MAASMKRSKLVKQKIGEKSAETPKEEAVPEPEIKGLHTDEDGIWCPDTGATLKLLLSARLAAALWSHITDCDETFNYWEPLHFLLFGNGFQTWEYSPAYAIRSYAYLWVNGWPLYLYTTLLGANKILSFYFLRCLLGIACAGCELYFYKGVIAQYGGHVARITLCLLLFSCGLFISSAAFLPSSLAMYCTLLAFGGWFHGHLHVAIMAVAASTFLAWPFAALIGVPIAVDILWRRGRYYFFVQWCGYAGAFILMPQVLIDTHYYGRFTIASLNIVLYNVFSEHGPDLYGVEPWWFYFKNGFLNFNLAFVAALVALPAVLLASGVFFKERSHKGVPAAISLVSLYLWILVFFTRPHKEERFLFPVYPLICLAAAFTIDAVQKFFHWVLKYPAYWHPSNVAAWFPAGFVVVYAVLNICRILALYYGYHAPLDVYLELTRISSDDSVHKLSPHKPVSVCVAKEWYRFPASFFLPEDNWRLNFVKSDFRGQLPQQFPTGPDATRVIPPNMNDLNLEEASRYVSSTRCHYLVDLDSEATSPDQPPYSRLEDEWKILYSAPFLDASRSHALARAFYVPFLSSSYSTYNNYNLLQTKRRKSKAKPKTVKVEETPDYDDDDEDLVQV